MSTAQPAIEAPVLRKEDPLALYWNDKVSSLATVAPFDFSEDERERHKIYSLTLMKLVMGSWNGNRKGTVGDYPWRGKQRWKAFEGLYRCHPVTEDDDPEPPGRDYLGHNIAALAVDGDGDIIDFEFNHNNVFASSVEHAESRLIRRIFSLTLLDQGWNLAKTPSATSPATFLDNVTVYTSLESCAQCSGIMTLAGIKEVVYLQKDFGAACIGNILYNLTTFQQDRPDLPPPKPIAAPKPIPACDFGFSFYNLLNDGYTYFFNQVLDKPFFRNGKDVDNGRSVVSFLCTDDAYGIFAAADAEFDNLTLHYPEFVPAASGPKAQPKSNQEIFKQARSFLDSSARARRGTPHRV